MSGETDELIGYRVNGTPGKYSTLGVTFRHAALTSDIHLTPWHSVTDDPVPYFAFAAEVGGQTVNFVSHPVEFSRPEISGDGQFRAGLSIANSGRALMTEVAKVAAQPQDPLTVEVNEYILGPNALAPSVAAADPFLFNVGDISGLGSSTVTFDISSTDYYGLRFPRRRYLTSEFPGLRREGGG